MKKNTTNKLPFTLRERTVDINSKFLFRFVKKFDKSEVWMLGDNISTHTERYFLFDITEKSNPNLFDNEVELKIGEYIYYVYETQEISLDINDSLGVELEQGLLIVK